MSGAPTATGMLHVTLDGTAATPAASAMMKRDMIVLMIVVVVVVEVVELYGELSRVPARPRRINCCFAVFAQNFRGVLRTSVPLSQACQ